MVEFSTAERFAISPGNSVLSQEPGNSARCRLKQPSSSAFARSTPQRNGFCGDAMQLPCSFGDMIWCDPWSLWGASWPPPRRPPQPWSKQLAVKISTSKATLLFSQLLLTLRKSMLRGSTVGSQLSWDNLCVPQAWVSKPTVDFSQTAAVAVVEDWVPGNMWKYLWIIMDH